MSHIITKENQIESVPKPVTTYREEILDQPLSDLFGVESGTKLDSTTVIFPSMNILSKDSDETLFRMDDNSLTLCRLKPPINEPRFCYVVKTKITSFGYETDKVIQWHVYFYENHVGAYSDIINKYVVTKNLTHRGFHIECNYNNLELTTIINLPKCDWYDNWLGNSKVIWYFTGGTMTRCVNT
jgi:hypothetical protein